jgi:hypothetical protein
MGGGCAQMALDVSDGGGGAAASGARARAPLVAPYATLDAGQLSELTHVERELRERGAGRTSGVRTDLNGELSRRDDAQPSRIGPTLWRPATPLHEATSNPAGLVRNYGDASNDPVSHAMSWMNAGSSRPVSRRGAGSARPATASNINLGWN